MGQTLVVGGIGIRKDAGMYSSPLAAVQAEWRPRYEITVYRLVPVSAPADSKGAWHHGMSIFLPIFLWHNGIDILYTRITE